MAERQNTGNAVPSNALADLNDNTITLDEFINSKSNYTQDRLGNRFRTLYKYMYDLEAAISTALTGSYLPIAGGTLSGDAIIKKSSPRLTLTESSNKNTTSLITNQTVFAVQVMNSDTNAFEAKLRYTMSTKKWDFVDSTVTIGGVSALKKGDYGIGSKAIHLTTNDLDDIITTQFSWFNANTAGTKPFESGWVISSNILDTQAMQVAISYPNSALAVRTSRLGIWGDWLTNITTANISNYVQNKVVAWGRFDYSTNNSINIIASSGVSSITRSSTGKYLVTLSNSIAGAKYAVTSNAQQGTNTSELFANISVPMNPTANNFEIWCGDNNQDKFFDTSNCYFTVVATNN